MGLRFTPGRIAILIVCIIGLVWLGGFDPPPGIRPRAWGSAVMMYLAGAGSVSLVEHSVGNLDRTNLRPAYVILGILLMTAAAVLLYSMQGVSPA